MLHIGSAQMAAITRSHFFARVAAFVGEHTTAAAYRAAAADPVLRRAVWTPHWPGLCARSEHDAALAMCFLLACATLGVDEARASAALRDSADPELGMKLFLSRHGLLRFSAFDVPELVTPRAAH